MSVIPLINARVFVDALDLTAFSNQVELDRMSDDLDVTTFASGGNRTRIGGLADSSYTVQGFWEAGDNTKPDDNLWPETGTAVAATFGPVGANVGDPAWCMQSLDTGYNISGSVGDPLGFTVKGGGTTPLGKGVFLHDPGTARTATGTGTIVLAGALAAGKPLVATLHILSAAGTTPSITAVVQSAAAAGFASPTTRATFNAATGQGSQVAQVIGPVTDTYWRLSWTITGTTPSFLLVAAIGYA